MKPLIRIAEGSIDEHAVRESVAHPSAGATAIFVGTTRDGSRGRTVRFLEYEVYRPMAEKTMTELSERASRQWPLLGVSIVHRSGRVGVGEAGVVIAVSSAHRTAAFEACRFLIHALKKEVPVWKKEVYEDGHSWVGTEEFPHGASVSGAQPP